MFRLSRPLRAQPAPASTEPRAVAAVIPPAEAAAADLDLRAPQTAAGEPAIDAPIDLPEAGLAALDFEAMEREWFEAGGLSEETYARLAGAGIPRPIVDRYVEGQAAMGRALRAELLAPIGGEAGFAELASWARKSLDRGEIDAYEAALQGTPEQARLALRGLHAAYGESNGRRPALVGGRRDGAETAGLFGSAAQVAEAIRDPRYKTDPGYRAEVQARLARSNVFGRR